MGLRNVLFENLPPLKRKSRFSEDPDDYDDDDRLFREILFYEPEGPLPVRRHRGGGFSSLPHATVLPLVTGTGAVGDTLSCSTGTWTNSPTSYAYQWLRDGVAIVGATASTYLLAAADSTHAISCTVTATAAGGSGSATSNAIAVT